MHQLQKTAIEEMLKENYRLQLECENNILELPIVIKREKKQLKNLKKELEDYLETGIENKSMESNLNTAIDSKESSIKNRYFQLDNVKNNLKSCERTISLLLSKLEK